MFSASQPPPKRPQSQMAFSSSQPSPSFLGPTVLRLHPQSVMLPPSRPSSQMSSWSAGENPPARQSRRQSSSISQEYGSTSPANANKSIQLFGRARFGQTPGGKLPDMNSYFPCRPHSVVPLQQQSTNVSNYNMVERMRGHDEILNHIHGENARALSIQKQSKVQKRAPSWQPDEMIGIFDEGAIYSGNFLGEPENHYPAILRAQRQRFVTADDTRPLAASKEVLDKDWTLEPVIHSPTTAALKRPESHQIRSQSASKKPRRTYDAIKLHATKTSQPLMQSTQVDSQPFSAQQKLTTRKSLPPQTNSASHNRSGRTEESDRAASSCMRCRRKHRMCDRILPTCGACASDSLICVAVHGTTPGGHSKKKIPLTTIDTRQEINQVYVINSTMHDSGVQFNISTQDAASQTSMSTSCTKKVNAGTSTSNETSCSAMQTDLRDSRLEITEWAELVTSMRELRDQQFTKGSQCLQRSTGNASEYEKRLLAAAICGSELMDSLIELVEKALNPH